MLSSLELKSRLELIVPDDEIFLPNTPHFKAHTTPWSLFYDRNPSIVLVPSTLTTLQEVVRFLHDSDFDFAVRGRGCGNSSAADVVLSMRSFDKILFDRENETVSIGAGLDWGQVDEGLATLVRHLLCILKSFHIVNFLVTGLGSQRHLDTLVSAILLLLSCGSRFS